MAQLPYKSAQTTNRDLKNENHNEIFHFLKCQSLYLKYKNNESVFSFLFLLFLENMEIVNRGVPARDEAQNTI